MRTYPGRICEQLSVLHTFCGQHCEQACLNTLIPLILKHKIAMHKKQACGQAGAGADFRTHSVDKIVRNIFATRQSP